MISFDFFVFNFLSKTATAYVQNSIAFALFHWLILGLLQKYSNILQKCAFDIKSGHIAPPSLLSLGGAEV